jgi:hypothetical protein
MLLSLILLERIDETNLVTENSEREKPLSFWPLENALRLEFKTFTSWTVRKLFSSALVKNLSTRAAKKQFNENLETDG